jgi:hypothetical protein
MGVDTRTSGFNVKKGISVFVGDIAEEDIVAGTVLFNLPPNSYVINAFLDVTTVSTTASSTVDLKVGTTVVNNEMAATVAGYAAGTVAPAKFATGGAVTAVVGSTAPAAGDLVCTLYVEYIEYAKGIGEFTNF